jgi:type I restriction enzyme M protein
LEEIEKKGFVLTPGRYVGASAEHQSIEDFAEKIAILCANWKELTAKSSELDSVIQRNLDELARH